VSDLDKILDVGDKEDIGSHIKDSLNKFILRIFRVLCELITDVIMR
jgi:hypothetical protein